MCGIIGALGEAPTRAGAKARERGSRRLASVHGEAPCGPETKKDRLWELL